MTNSTGGTIYGATSGIYVNGYGTVTNIGVSTISSRGTGVDILLAGTVSNLSGGVISGGTADAVFIYGAGKANEQTKVLVNNAGLLQGSSGVEEFLGGYVTNIAGGTILGTSNIGVFLDGSGSISNSGLINGLVRGLPRTRGARSTTPPAERSLARTASPPSVARSSMTAQYPPSSMR